MGYYSKAHSTEKLASTSISKVMTEVTYPLYAEAQDNKVALGNMIKRITMTLSYITFPLMFVMLLCAKPLFILLYTERWLSSVPYFQVLCISGLAFCLQSVNLQAISAFGMRGLLVGVVLNSWISYFVNIGLVSKHVGYSWKNQVKDIVPVLLASIISFIVSYSVSLALGLSLYLDGVVKLVCFIIIYIGWSFVFKPNSFQYFVSILKSLVLKTKYKKQ